MCVCSSFVALSVYDHIGKQAATNSGGCRDTAITNNDNNMTTQTLQTLTFFRLLTRSCLRISPSESMSAVEMVAASSRNL